MLYTNITRIAPVEYETLKAGPKKHWRSDEDNKAYPGPYLNEIRIKQGDISEIIRVKSGHHSGINFKNKRAFVSIRRDAFLKKNFNCLPYEGCIVLGAPENFPWSFDFSDNFVQAMYSNYVGQRFDETDREMIKEKSIMFEISDYSPTIRAIMKHDDATFVKMMLMLKYS